jgi:hypothetical protein
MPRGARKKSPFFWGMINLPVIEWSKTPATDYQYASLIPLHADLDILAKKNKNINLQQGGFHGKAHLAAIMDVLRKLCGICFTQSGDQAEEKHQ